MGLKRLLALAALGVAMPAFAQTQAGPERASATIRQAEDARLLAMLNAFARAQETLDPVGAIARGENSPEVQLGRLYSDELAAARRIELRRQLARSAGSTGRS